MAGEPIVIQAGSGTSAPKQPQAWVDADDVVHLTFGAGEQVYYTRREADSFSKPLEAFRIPNMSLGMRRGPRVAASPTTVVITAIGGVQGKGRDGDVLAYHSVDAGKSWRGPTRVNDVQSSAREGLHAMTCIDDGTFVCVWLDLRDKRTELYLSRSTDQGLTWSKNVLVYRSPDQSICECCHPSLVSHGQALHVLFRNSIKGNRDMYVVSSADGGANFSQAERLGSSHWELNACPMDGGMLAVGPAGSTTAVWRRGGMIFASRSDDTAEQVLGKGEQAWIAVTQDLSHVVWTSAREGDLQYAKLHGGAAQKLAERARDPVIVAGRRQPDWLAVFWEQRDGDRTSILSRILPAN